MLKARLVWGKGQAIAHLEKTVLLLERILPEEDKRKKNKKICSIQPCLPQHPKTKSQGLVVTFCLTENSKGKKVVAS